MCVGGGGLELYSLATLAVCSLSLIELSKPFWSKLYVSNFITGFGFVNCSAK